MNGAVFLTGATGFLGQRVAAALVRQGRAVHALVRASSDLSGLEGLGVRAHVGDVVDASSVSRALEAALASSPAGVLDLVHAAALISYRSGDAEAQRRVNVEGTWNVLDATYRAGVRRVVHVGSVVAVGQRTGEELVHEEMAWNAAPIAVDYATTKRAAEDLALLAAREQHVTIVDPGAIFGAGPDRVNSVYMLRELARGRRAYLVPPGGMSLVGVDDCAEGVLLALEHGRRGERYLLVESNLSLHELLALVARECGGHAPGPVAPKVLWEGVVRAAAVLDRLRPQERLTPQSMRMAATDWRADGSKARRELGWEPAPFGDVLRRALRELGLVGSAAP